MSFTGFFFGRNRKSNNGRCTSCGKLRCNSVRTRTLSMEPLETRDLLSVTTGLLDSDDAANVAAVVSSGDPSDVFTVDFPEQQVALQSNFVTPDGYNDNDYQKMVAFLEQTDSDGVKNGMKLNANYNPVDPTTWNNISWTTVDGEKRITEINFPWKELVGAADFSNMNCLNQINFQYNQLTSLDVSGCTSLAMLNCGDNQLTSLDISELINLKELNCRYNNIISLDVSRNTLLTMLWCFGNKLTTLDVTRNLALQNLYCSQNPLKSLDVSKNIALTSLYCDSNQLTYLDVSKNIALISLSCGSNQLKTLDLSNNPDLKNLFCYYNQFMTLDISANTMLVQLYCHNNQLNSLDISMNTKLSNLRCHSNHLTSLDVSNNTELTWLDCYYNQFTELNLRNNTKLTTLQIGDSYLSSVHLFNDQIEKLRICFYDSSYRVTSSQGTSIIQEYASSSFSSYYQPTVFPFSATNISTGKVITFDDLCPLIDLTLSTNSPEIGTILTSTIVPANATVEYQWYCGDTLINGATESTFTVTADYIGQTITCVATGTGVYTGAVNVTTAEVPKLPLETPNAPTLSAEETTVTATWSRVNNASSYTVMYQIDGADGWTTIADIQGTSTSFVGVAGKKYNVKVQANGTGIYSDSEFSEAKSITLADPSIPLIGLTLSNYSPEVGSVITASLNPENATANYQWYCGETLIVGATTSSFTVTENQINQTITCVATGTGDYAGSVNATTAPVVALKLKTPSISSLSNNGTIVTASWAAVENASSYAIEYQLDGSDRWTTIGLQNTTALFIGEMGKTYNVRVKAVGTGVYADSAYSETEKIKLLIPLSVPQLYNVTTVGMEMNVVWSDVNNASGYAVEYKLGDSDWSVLTTTNATTASLIGQPGSEYAFRVKAIGTGVYADSAYSQVKTVEIDDALDAQNDFVKTTLNTPAVIDYRANDEATDWSVVTVQFGKASHGEYTVNEDGTIVYTPEDGFYGTDLISYVLVSPSGKFSPGAIAVSVGLPIATSVQKTSGAHTPSTAMAASVDSLTEWDSCYIELWAQGVNELSAGETTITMSYNPAVYSAPTFAACADGAVLSVSQGVELPDGSVQVELTVSTTQALSSQTDNLFLGTVVLTPSMEQGAGIADPLVSESICTLDGVNLTTTVETMSYDLTHSGKVDVDDFVAFATVFGLKPGNMSPEHPLYALAVKADFNKDGVVNSDDFIAFSINFGASKAAAVKPVAQPGAEAELRSASNELREDELNSECEIRNAELIDSQVEFSEMELAVPTVQPASPISQSSPCGESVIPFASLTPLPPSNHSTLEAYSAALLDLYENQDRADLTGSSDVLTESRMDAPIFGVDDGSSQKTSSSAIDVVLQEDFLEIDWKE